MRVADRKKSWPLSTPSEGAKRFFEQAKQYEEQSNGAHGPATEALPMIRGLKKAAAKAVAESIEKQPELSGSLPDPLARNGFFQIIPKRRDQCQDIPVKDVYLGGPLNATISLGYIFSIFDQGVVIALGHLMMKQRSLSIKTTYSELCSILGLRYHATSIQTIKKALHRFKQTTFTLKDQRTRARFEAHSSIISDFFREDDKLAIILGAGMWAFYESKEYALIVLKFRQQLQGDTAKGLFVFFCNESHKRKHWYYTSTLCVHAGYSYDKMKKESQYRRDAKRNTRKAMNQLKKLCFLSFKYDKNQDKYFHVIKLPRESWMFDRPKLITGKPSA